MPNGGMGHCGGCLYNFRLLMGLALSKYFGVNPGFCTLRKVIIPNCGYTYCHNCEYDDFGEKMREEQVKRVLGITKIKGTIWTDNTYSDSGWHGSPHDEIDWNYNEWKKWNGYVKRKYPQLDKMEWIKNVDPFKD